MSFCERSFYSIAEPMQLELLRQHAVIDQPIGVDFSYGTDSVTSTVTPAPYVWKLLQQAFYAQFPQYENRNFGVFTESYGGHYGPEFADYFEQENAAISAGSVKGPEHQTYCSRHH